MCDVILLSSACETYLYHSAAPTTTTRHHYREREIFPPLVRKRGERDRAPFTQNFIRGTGEVCFANNRK